MRVVFVWYKAERGAGADDYDVRYCCSVYVTPGSHLPHHRRRGEGAICVCYILQYPHKYLLVFYIFIIFHIDRVV